MIRFLTGSVVLGVALGRNGFYCYDASNEPIRCPDYVDDEPDIMKWPTYEETCSGSGTGYASGELCSAPGWYGTGNGSGMPEPGEGSGTMHTRGKHTLLTSKMYMSAEDCQNDENMKEMEVNTFALPTGLGKTSACAACVDELKQGFLDAGGELIWCEKENDEYIMYLQEMEEGTDCSGAGSGEPTAIRYDTCGECSCCGGMFCRYTWPEKELCGPDTVPETYENCVEEYDVEVVEITMTLSASAEFDPAELMEKQKADLLEVVGLDQQVNVALTSARRRSETATSPAGTYTNTINIAPRVTANIGGRNLDDTEKTSVSTAAKEAASTVGTASTAGTMSDESSAVKLNAIALVAAVTGAVLLMW